MSAKPGKTPLKWLWLLLYILKHRLTFRLLLFVVFMAGVIEYKIYQDFKQLGMTYQNNFSVIATAAAEKVAAGQNYCIIAPDYLDKHSWLMLNDFTELDINRVLKQAVYFRLGWFNRVKVGVGQRVPHFELYADGKHYFWSFSQQGFYQYRIQNTVFDRYLWLVCKDLAGKTVDRRKATAVYQHDPQWIKILGALQYPNNAAPD